MSFTFTDNAKDKSDDISLTLEDRAGTWLNDWTPSKSDTITASIICTDTDEAVSLPCGSFSVDQIEYSYPPAVLSIKAVSSDIKTKISQTKHTRYWENVTLSSIAGDIASDNGLGLYMTPSEGPTLERIDQTEQTDLEFMRDLAGDFGCGVKVQKGRLVVYLVEEFEMKGPVDTINLNEDRVLNVKFTSKSAKVYRKARVKYHDPLKDEVYSAEIEDDTEEGSERVLEIHERVESQSHAERVARERLTDANRKEVTGTLTLMGNVNIAAGVTITVEGAGTFSGKHYVNKATHKVDSSGYTTAVELGQPKEAKGKKKEKKKAKQTRGTGSVLYYEGDRHY